VPTFLYRHLPAQTHSNILPQHPTYILISTPAPTRPRTPHLSVVPLPSPRTIQIQHTRAVRRGAAWPLAERPSSCLTARSAVSRTDRAASPPSLHGTPSAAGAVRRNTVRRPSGQPLGVVAQDIRSWPCLVPLSGPGQHPASSVRCERPVSTPAMSTRPVSSVRCGRPGVRCPCGRPGGCPVWASGVRWTVGRPGIWASGVR
jgi:hypothetical protein